MLTSGRGPQRGAGPLFSIPAPEAGLASSPSSVTGKMPTPYKVKPVSESINKHKTSSSF